MHIPEPRRHVIRYYGAYSSVVRARRRHMPPAVAGLPSAPEPPAAGAPADPELRALRRRWAELIRRIYEADPLVCPRCGATMRIVAFITEPAVIRRILRHLAAKAVDARGPPYEGLDQALAMRIMGQGQKGNSYPSEAISRQGHYI
jgi:hypothetical protein